MTRRRALRCSARRRRIARRHGDAGCRPPAQAVLRFDLNQGNVQPLPIALPDFLAGSPARRRGGAQHLRRSSPPISSAADCSRRSIRRPSSKRSPIPTCRRAFPTGAPSTPRRWSPGAITRQADGRIKAEFRLWDVFGGSPAHRPAIFLDAGQFPPHRPHHLRCDLRAADRRERLFRQPRRVRGRDRPQGAARQAARHDGPGRRQCPLSHPRRRPRAHAALLADDPGNHLHVVRPGRSAGLSAQHRNLAARDRRQFPRHDVSRRASRPTASASS